jgi:flagellar biosynthesis/type III secretory pathway chaperone
MAADKPSPVEQLHTVLANEADGYRQLVAYTRQEQEALKQANLADLAIVVQSKEKLMVTLQMWESTREQLVARLAQEFGLSPTTSLTDLIGKLDQTIAAKLTALRNEFVLLMEQLLLLNHGNRLMLKAGLVRVDATFDYLASLAAPPVGQYSSNGHGHQPPAAIRAGHVLNWEV